MRHARLYNFVYPVTATPPSQENTAPVVKQNHKTHVLFHNIYSLANKLCFRCNGT